MKRLPYFVDSVNLVALGQPRDPLNPLKGFMDVETGLFINNAVVVLDTIKDETTNNPVSWQFTNPLPLSMAYKAGSNGVYSVKVPVGPIIAAGQLIQVGILATVGGLTSRRFWVPYYGELG